MGSSLFPILTYVNSKGYAVVDFETTGLNPARGDRAIEIGLVHVAPDGTLEDEHETLIRVHRDIGAQWIHHISAVELMRRNSKASRANYVTCLRGVYSWHIMWRSTRNSYCRNIGVWVPIFL